MNHKNNRVCHLSTVHSAFDVRIFYRECKTLVNAGYSVYLVVSHNKDEIVDGVHLIHLPTKKGRAYRLFIKDWIALFKAIKTRAQVYHFHDPELIFVGLLLKLFGKKVVYDVHEVVSKQILSKNWIPLLIRKILSALFRKIEEKAILLFDAIVVAGEDIVLQHHFKKFSDKIYLVRNFPTISTSESVVSNKNYDKIKFIYTGGLSDDRGILEIVEAAKLIELSNFELTLLGTFKSPVFQEKILSAISGDRRIKYISSVSYKEMFNILVNYHVGLICFKPTPNNIGALSGRNNKIYEYLKAGLAVIGSNFPLWKEFILGNNVGLVVNPMNINDIAESMKFCINHRKELIKMQRNAKELSSKYSWAAEGKKLILLYKELIK